MLVTIPTIGYVAADHNAGGDVNQTPNYIAVRFKRSVPRKGAPFTLTPDTTDGFVYQDEYINFLDQTYPGAFAAPLNPIFISLDNEVDLWAFTHARLRGDATNPIASQAGTHDRLRRSRAAERRLRGRGEGRESRRSRPSAR